MRRHITRASQLAIDLAALAGAFAIAFLLRFDWDPPTTMVGRLFLTAPYVVVFEYVVLVVFGVHRMSWRYVSLRDATRILGATTVANLALVASRLIVGELQYEYGYLRHGVIPMGVVAANYALMFLAISGVRVLRRVVGERAEAGHRLAERSREPEPTMLVGAGQAGVLVARELSSRPDLGLKPVGFLDDDPAKHGTVVHGTPVVGSTADLGELCRRYGATQVLITMASAPGKVVRRIRQLCDEAGLPVKIVPGLYEIVGGQVNLSRIRDVAIEDLLGREPVELDTDAIAEVVRGHVVLVTGAGGSIGAELARQAARFDPERVVLVERAENNLFEIHRELEAAYPQLAVTPHLVNVTDRAALDAVYEQERPAAVLHAAAHKHVPMIESNPSEAVKNNVFGTKVAGDLAHAYGVETFVMISTDKAVRPTSVMGATKRVAEMYVQALSARSDTRFVTVRFGNVLGSAGSVLPIFKQQIAQGGPVTVTHPDMKRYFMTIPEACQLVLQAASMGDGGEIFILDMGEPVRIADLARDLISLSGLREGEDIEIEFTGTRPGEKLFEELSTDSEHADKTRHPKIFIGKTPPAPEPQLETGVGQLDAATQRGSGYPEVVDALQTLVHDFRPSVPDSQGKHPESSYGPGDVREPALSLQNVARGVE